MFKYSKVAEEKDSKVGGKEEDGNRKTDLGIFEDIHGVSAKNELKSYVE